MSKSSFHLFDFCPFSKNPFANTSIVQSKSMNIGEGKKHGKGIAALKHRADSLTRLGKKDLDDAADMNANGMSENLIL